MSSAGKYLAHAVTYACRSCGAPIIFAVTRSGKRIPIEPNQAGNLELRGGVIAFVTPDINAMGRYQSHFASCPQAGQHRKPKKEEP